MFKITGHLKRQTNQVKGPEVQLIIAVEDKAGGNGNTDYCEELGNVTLPLWSRTHLMQCENTGRFFFS